MEISEEWKKFSETGKISDYLNYIKAEHEIEMSKEININDNNRRNCNKGT